jgi:hypothetical protein
MEGKFLPVSLLIWLLATAVWATLSPFQLGAGDPPGIIIMPDMEPGNLGHVVLLVPLGMVLATAAHIREGRWPVMHPWLVATAVAFVLEVGQWWVEGRAVAVHDFVVGSAGAAGAVVGTRFVLLKGVAPTRLCFAAGASTLSVLAAAVVFGGSFPERDFRIQGWDAGFPIVVGHEADGARGFAGEVRDARICAGEGPTRICAGPGASREIREELVAVAQETQTVFASARIRSEDPHQAGPARIVTFSRNTSERNLMLGQDGADLVFRIRTRWTGLNGSAPAFVLPGALVHGEDLHVEAWFSEGRVEVSARVEDSRVSGDYPSQAPEAALQLRWGGGSGELILLEGPGSLLAAGLLLAGIGLGAAWRFRHRPFLRWGVGPGVAVAGLFLHDRLLLGPPHPTPRDLLFALAWAVTGALLTLLDRR